MFQFQTATEALVRYEEVRRRTLELCAPLEIEDYVAQSMVEASPVRWHIAHTTWFFEQFLLGPHASGYRVFHPDHGFLFNSYYNAVGERTPRGERGLLTRPTVREIRDYRRHVDLAVRSFLEDPGKVSERAREILELGLNHEQQHQELILTDLKHLLSLNPLRPAYRADAAPYSSAYRMGGMAEHSAHRGNGGPERPLLDPGPVRWIRFEAGPVWIGHDGSGFAFDNEGPRHQTWLAPFELADRPVTNREFLAFIEDGGYRRPELWLDDGWSQVRKGLWRAPLYWEMDPDETTWDEANRGEANRDESDRGGSSRGEAIRHKAQPDESERHQPRRAEWSSDEAGRCRVFTLAGLLPINLDEPVCHVSFYEADAFARWAGARLPLESEWETACRAGSPAPGTQAPTGNFAETGRFHPEPCSPIGSGALRQMLGDVWEWTASPYAPYPGFHPVPGALGEYNGKFMLNQIVLRGGSCATPESHIRPTYRNFFYPEARWQFTGLRLARDAS